jgi:endonuclease III
VLARYYGSLRAAEPPRAFGLILWENVAYLVDERVRASTFASLVKQVGSEPRALLRAGIARVEAAIRSGGMRPKQRAEKVVACARLATDLAKGDLDSTLRALPEQRARILLKRFPGIGIPGADKILLFTKLSDRAALESNGLRVVQRVTGLSESVDYAAGYRAATNLLGEAGIRGATARRAFLLLREHGRRICRRTNPDCRICPLRRRCAYALKWGVGRRAGSGNREAKVALTS